MKLFSININQSIKDTLLRFFIFFVVSFFYLYFVSLASSPYSDLGGAVDYGIFVTMGEYLLKNGGLYHGLFDNKGPYLFMIHTLGLLISNGKWGIFILEVLNLAVCLEILYRIGRILNSSKAIIISGIVVSLFFMSFMLDNGSTVEEWSLPFVLLPLYLSLKYLKSNSKPPVLFSIVYGICFGIIAMMRINNDAIIVGIILGLSYFLIKKKEYKVLLINAIYFLIGLIIGILPAIIYSLVIGELQDMLFATFTYNFYYKQVWGVTDNSIRINCMRLSFLILTIFASYIYERKTHSIIFPIIFCCTIVSFLTFYSGSPYLHYMIMIIPFVFITWILLPYLNKVLASLYCFVIAYCWFTEWHTQFYLSKAYSMSNRILSINTNQIADKIKTIITEDELNSIYSLNLPLYYSDLFLKLGSLPVGKYYTQQTYVSLVHPKLPKDIIQNFEESHPQWIISCGDKDNTLLKEASINYIKVDSIKLCDNLDDLIIYKLEDENYSENNKD